jgi:uncharacterized protein
LTVPLQQLLELSRIDMQLAGLEEQRSSVPGRRAAALTQRTATEARLASAREEVTKAEQAQRRSEGLAADQETLLKKLQGQQLQVKTNDAYTALLSEMERAQTAISEAETHVLEAMDAIELSRGRLREIEADLRNVRAHTESEEQACDALEKDLSEQVTRLREARDAAASRLDARLLTRYEKIAPRRRPAVTFVVAQICNGCRVGIPPQVLIEIQRAATPISCPNCNRILVLEEQLRG